MLQSSGCRKPRARSGVAAAELAVLLPFLCLLFVGAVDFARVFYFYITVTNCARNGALYGSIDPTHAADTTGIQNAALADAQSLSVKPNITSKTGNDANGDPYVAVNATYTFQTITNYPGILNSVNLSRTIQMRVTPVLPNFN